MQQWDSMDSSKYWKKLIISKLNPNEPEFWKIKTLTTILYALKNVKVKIKTSRNFCDEEKSENLKRPPFLESHTEP
jgi:hypothetical protein